MDIVVTKENVPQIVQAMYENVKSNQHRINTMEPVLTKMAKQVEGMDALLVRNGFAKAVETNAEELKEFRGEFQEFQLSREESCPVSKRSTSDQKKSDRKRTWQVTVLRTFGTIVGTISTVIVIIEKVIL